MKPGLISIFFILATVITIAQTTSKLIRIFNNRLMMSVPFDVNVMTEEQINYKYKTAPDSKSFYYANQDLTFSIVLAPVADSVTETEMLANKDGIIDGITSKGFKVEEYEIRKINNHTLIIVAFYSEPAGGRVLNKRFYGVVNNKMIMVSFNCAADELMKRKYQIEQSINSVEIKD